MIAAGDALKTKHARYVLTPWLAQGNLQPPVIVRGEGIYLYDEDGNRYADLTSGLIAVNLGHGHPAVRAAMHEQVDRLCFSPPSWFNDVRAELGEALVRLAPWGDEGGRVFFTTSGAAANEDAIKLARAVTGRAKVLDRLPLVPRFGRGLGDADRREPALVQRAVQRHARRRALLGAVSVPQPVLHRRSRRKRRAARCSTSPTRSRRRIPIRSRRSSSSR